MIYGNNEFFSRRPSAGTRHEQKLKFAPQSLRESALDASPALEGLIVSSRENENKQNGQREEEHRKCGNWNPPSSCPVVRACFSAIHPHPPDVERADS